MKHTASGTAISYVVLKITGLLNTLQFFVTARDLLSRLKKSELRKIKVI